MKQRIHTDQAPKAIGPYSQAVLAGDFLTFPDRFRSIPRPVRSWAAPQPNRPRSRCATCRRFSVRQA